MINIKKLNALLAVLIVVSVLVPMRPVRADIAPPPEVELSGIQPQFQKTEVAMLYERVEMELGIYYDYSAPSPIQNRVVVNAYFMMQNQGTVDESMQVIFPSESNPVCRGNYQGDSFTAYHIVQDSFQVSINGVVASTTMIKTPYGTCDDFSWWAFDVAFPVGEEILVKVSYEMQTWIVDTAQNIDYVLETGAGWKGNIGRAYIILKFPYIVTSENILSSTTEGYQTLYNEIFWSFQNLEPTPKDNIHISIVSPNIWLDIQRLREQIESNPESPDAWLELIDIYKSIGFDKKGDYIRNGDYVGLAESAYRQAIVGNPNSAKLIAQYAKDRLYRLSPRLGRVLTSDEATEILSLLNKALALDPNDEVARQTLSDLLAVAPFITFTPPPTIPPTATSLFTSTPSVTPSVTITPTPTETPIVVTVIHTKLVNASTSTKTSEPTATIAPTEIQIQGEAQEETGSSSMFLGALVIFAVGIGSGWFLSKRLTK